MPDNECMPDNELTKSTMDDKLLKIYKLNN